ncbi:MAG: hypothetical protein AAFP90_12015 [Planctomycetota bacterium]
MRVLSLDAPLRLVRVPAGLARTLIPVRAEQTLQVRLTPIGSADVSQSIRMVDGYQQAIPRDGNQRFEIVAGQSAFIEVGPSNQELLLRVDVTGLNSQNAADLLAHSLLNHQLSAEDVDNNGTVSPLDALLVIQELTQRARSGEGRLEFAHSGENAEIQEGTLRDRLVCLDVNRDQMLSAIDALLVVQRLIQNARQETNGESSGDLAGLSENAWHDAVYESIAVLFKSRWTAR